jgi:hypothetical protein
VIVYSLEMGRLVGGGRSDIIIAPHNCPYK